MTDGIKVPLDGENTDEEIVVVSGSEPVLPDATPQLAVNSITLKPKKGRSEGDRASALMDRFTHARNTRTASGIEDEWAECERLYMQEDDAPEVGEWRSDAFVPHATREVNNATPHTVSALLDSEQLVRMTTPDKACQDYAEIEEQVCLYQLEQKMEIEQTLELVAKQAAMLGTAVTFTGFEKVKKNVKRKQEVPVAEGLTIIKDVEETVVVDAYNTLTQLDITDVWVDPFATPDYLPRLWVYERKSIRQMRDGGLPYKNLDKLPETPFTTAEFIMNNSYQNDDGIAVGSRQTNTVLTDSLDVEDRLHHLVHEWDFEKNTWSVVADGDTEILAPRPIPYNECPFTFWRHDLVPNRFYGRGVVAPIAKSCRNANRLRRQRDDNVELCLNKMFVTRTGAIMDEQAELIWRPGGNIHIRGGSLDNAIKVLEMGDVTASAYQDERIIKDDIEAVNGISNIAAGVPDSKARTATGTSILRQMAVLRLRGPIRHMLTAFRKVVTAMVANNQKFLPDSVSQNMLGDQARLYKMYKDRFKPGMKVAITVHPADLYTNIEVQNAGLINATNVLGQLGLLNFVDQKALTKLLLKRIAGLRDTDQLLNSGEQLFTANDFAMILQESNLLLQGQQIQPQPTDNHKAHVEGHRAVLGTYTFSPNAPALLEHIKMHEQFMAALAAQMMGGPAALPDMMGGAGGGVNPARQPAPTSDEAASRSAGNAAGAVGEPGGF